MKKIFLLTLTTLFINFYANAQTTLSAGDVAVVLYNADNPDEVQLVLLAPIASGTSIYVTDHGWLSTGAFRANEGVDTFTATSDMTCGDIFSVSGGAGFALSASGDQALVFQGTIAAPTFMTGFNNEGAAVWQTTATNSNTSALPTGLTDGTNAVSVTETDNVVYTGTLSGTRAALRAALMNSANFSGSNTTRQTFTSSFTVTDCPVLPVTMLYFKGEVENDQSKLEWATATEENNDYFEVQRSFNAKNYETIATINGAGNSHEIINYSFIDEHPGETNYYRLKQVDYDFKYEYSDVVKVSQKKTDFAIQQDEHYINLVSYKEFETSYTITNSVGEVISAGNFNSSERIAHMDWSHGVYFIHLESGGDYEVIKVVNR